MKNLSLSTQNVGLIIADCADIAKATATTDQHACGNACTIVATIIASARRGSADQSELMLMAENAGFRCEYWTNSVRVNFTPADV